ncbi:Cytochrome b561 and DOMON domain-containing protein [Dirofilaria immitis]
MAASIKTAPFDHDYHSGTTHSLDVVPAKEGVYAALEKDEEGNFVKFVREKKQPDLARVKLSFFNNSKRLVEWTIKSAYNDNIQALPKASGLIKAFDTNECTLIWQRPKDYNSWRELSVLKMMLQIKVLANENGKIVGKMNSKFQAAIDPNAVCAAEEPPIHKIVLNSRLPDMILRKEKSKTKIDANNEIEAKIKNKHLQSDSQITHWIVILLFCLLITSLMKILSEDDIF